MLQKTIFLSCVSAISLFFFTNPSFAQNTKYFNVGLEVQAYPTGVISGIHLEWGISKKDALHTRIGYNVVRHRDLGVHQDERGGGFGFSIGYRHYFKENHNGVFIGAKSDLWFNKIDWKDNIDAPNELIGQTNITVLQPTAVVGYILNIGKNGWNLASTIAVGAEINVKTNGAEVGQGTIVLLGLMIGKRF